MATSVDCWFEDGPLEGIVEHHEEALPEIQILIPRGVAQVGLHGQYPGTSDHLDVDRVIYVREREPYRTGCVTYFLRGGTLARLAAIDHV